MTSGRLRKPTAKRKAEGLLAHRPLPPDEPKPPVLARADSAMEMLSYPAMPDDPAALGEWMDDITSREKRRILAVFAATPGLVTVLDITPLEMYCHHWAEWVKCREIARGAPPSHRVHAAMRHQAAILNKLMAEFGMGPASRSRIAINLTKQDPMGDLDN